MQPSNKQIAKLSHLVRTRDPDFLPGEFMTMPNPENAEKFFNVNINRVTFTTWVMNNLTFHSAGTIIDYFEENKDQIAYRILAMLGAQLVSTENDESV